MLQMSLGFTDLTLINAMSAFGSTSGGMIHYAAAAIEAGQANVVVLVYADAPLQAGRLGRGVVRPAPGATRAWAACTARTACSAPTTATPWPPAGTCTCTARRASSSVPSPWPSASGRCMNDKAQMRTPLTLEEHQASRWICEPLHLYDCCLVSNGAVAFVLTSPERARSLRQPPVYVLGVGPVRAGRQRSGRPRPGRPHRRHGVGPPGARHGRRDAGRRRRARAVRLLHVHRARDAGGLRLLRQGRGRRLRGGRQAGARRLAAVQHRRRPAVVVLHVGLHAAVGGACIQARGDGGERQVPKHDVVLVSGNGGILNYHSTIVLVALRPLARPS